MRNMRNRRSIRERNSLLLLLKVEMVHCGTESGDEKTGTSNGVAPESDVDEGIE